MFGKRAGDAAAEAAHKKPGAMKAKLDPAEIQSAIATLMGPLDRASGENPYKLMGEIQDVMTEHAPIVRDGAGLAAGLEKIEALGVRAKACGAGGTNSLAFNPGWHTAYDLRSMLVNAEALLRCALERKRPGRPRPFRLPEDRR